METVVKKDGGYAIMETVYQQGGGIDEYNPLIVGKFHSWKQLQQLCEVAELSWQNPQYRIDWHDDNLGFNVYDKRLGYFIADVRALITDYTDFKGIEN